MRITDVQTTPFSMARHDTTWRTSTYASPSVDAVLVEILTDEGPKGMGLAPVIEPRGDTTAAIVSTIRDFFRPKLVGRDPFAIESIMRDLRDWARSAHHARTGIDLALFDLKARAYNMPVYELLGGACRREVPIIRMIGMKEPVAQAKRAAEVVENGFRLLKLKIGSNPDVDVRRVAEVRNAVGDGITLTVDANGAYDAKTAIQLIRRLEPLGVVLAEQPTPYHDMAALARVTRAVDMPVMADQAVDTLADAKEAICREAADVISVKVMQGGLLAAQKMRALCEAASMPYHLAGIASSRLLEAASVHFAVTCTTLSYGCEIAEFEDVAGDPAAGLEVVNGMLRVPDGPGLGISMEALARTATGAVA
jgi:L-alanine-DL-glutamate epimerase-like enolase superfamily enzyme